MASRCGVASNGPKVLVNFEDRLIYEAGLRYEDLVQAVDVVFTKPGYGIISECIANDTAIAVPRMIHGTGVGRRPAVSEFAMGVPVAGSGFIVMVISWLPRIPCAG